MIVYKNGDLFDSTCDILVHPCNCVGKYKKGLSSKFYHNYPKAIKRYRELCTDKLISVNYETIPEMCFDSGKFIIHIPIKINFWDTTQEIWVENGLTAIKNILNANLSYSLAMPYLSNYYSKYTDATFTNQVFKILSQCTNLIEIIKYN